MFIDFMVYKLFYILFSVEGTAFKRCFETKILYIIHPLQYFNGNYTGIFDEFFLYRSGLLGHEISGAPQIFFRFSVVVGFVILLIKTPNREHGFWCWGHRTLLVPQMLLTSYLQTYLFTYYLFLNPMI